MPSTVTITRQEAVEGILKLLPTASNETIGHALEVLVEAAKSDEVGVFDTYGHGCNYEVTGG